MAGDRPDADHLVERADDKLLSTDRSTVTVAADALDAGLLEHSPSALT